MSLVFRSIGIVVLLSSCLLLTVAQVPKLLGNGAKPIEDGLKGGESLEYRVRLENGHFFSSTITQKGIDVVLTLLDPDGKEVLKVNSPTGKNGLEYVWHVAEKSGEFTLRVTSPEPKAEAGAFTIQVNELRPADQDDRNFTTASYIVLDGINTLNARKADAQVVALARIDEGARLYNLIQNNLNAKANGFARIGRSYRSARKPLFALEYFDRAIELFLSIGQKRDAMLNLVETQGMVADTSDFIKRNERVRDLAIEIGDLGYQTGSLMQMARGYYDLGDFSNAVTTINAALRIAKETKDERRLEGIYNNMGAIYQAQGNYLAAFEAHDRSIAIQLARNGGKLTGDSLLNIGNVYQGLGKFDSALDYYGKALAHFEAINANIGMAYAISNIGVVHLEMGSYDKALEYFLRSQPLKAKFLPKDPKTAFNIAAVYKYKGTFDKALENAEIALEMCRSLKDAYHEVDTLVMISDLHFLRGDFEKALATANEAEALSRRFEFDKQLWKALGAAANANLALGNVGKAHEQLDAAVVIIENARKSVAIDDAATENYFEGRTDPYTSLIDLLVGNRDERGALEMAERIKARTLLDSLSSERANIANAMSGVERDAERRLKNELAILNTDLNKQNDPTEKARAMERLERKRLEFEDFRTRLYAANPELRIKRGELKPISAAEMGEFLTNNTVLLEFVVSGKKSFVFVVRKGGTETTDVSVKAIPLGRADVTSKIAGFQAKISSGDLAFQKSSRELYDLLLKPLESELAGKTNIIIVPDGPLWDLPFQALQDEKGKYLIEKAAISYAPSLTALREMSKKAKTRKLSPEAELLAFGNPIVGKETSERVKRVFMSEKLDPLPEAERLVNELGKLYGPMRSKILTGNAAREETAKTESPKYRIVQFATHGILNNASPMYSHLVMAQGEKNPNEDGLLEAWELKDLDLKADMVILSACDTARGKISNGEGVIGMTWASFIAGAPTTVASQWKVESRSTTELMLEFHRQMLAKKRVSKAEALRRASLKLMKMPQYRHPSYWAGFVLVGDGS